MQCTEAGVAIALRPRVERTDREDALPILCVKCRNSSTGCLGATVVDRKGASDFASSFLTPFIKRLGFKRILVRSDTERSLLSLIERVLNNLTGV